jgi:hypothetical protein
LVVASFVSDRATGIGVKPFVFRIIEVGLPCAGAREHADIIAMHPQVDAAKLLRWCSRL